MAVTSLQHVAERRIGDAAKTIGRLCDAFPHEAQEAVREGYDGLVLWGSDYPHADSTFPGATAELFETIASLDTDVQRRILGLNAADLYGMA